jgi:ADP-ribosyl-[dinitrogen reductase] hydrolase
MTGQISRSRAQGCLLGQLAGDSLGGLVEFYSPATIKRLYPEGVRFLADGGRWDTIAGQPTDDSEMALMLARTLIEQGVYDPVAARKAYVFWLRSGPFDCGNTVSSGLRGQRNPESQANGALMRISPLGIVSPAPRRSSARSGSLGRFGFRSICFDPAWKRIVASTGDQL